MFLLLQVKESLASEQSSTRKLDHSLTRISSSVNVGLAEISGLREENKKLVAEFQHLSSSFASLLKDAIRHSDVLELLLGEEVLEFLQWPVQDQEANSIPALKEQLGQLQEQLREHDLSITSLSGNRPGMISRRGASWGLLVLCTNKKLSAFIGGDNG